MTALRTKGFSSDLSSSPTRRSDGTLAVLVLLFAAAGLLIWRAVAFDKELAAGQDRLVAEVVRGTAAAIFSQLQTLQRGVALLAEDEAVLLRELTADPGNEELRDALHARITRAFPDAFAFTLADSDGAPLLEDFEGASLTKLAMQGLSAQVEDEGSFALASFEIGGLDYSGAVEHWQSLMTDGYWPRGSLPRLDLVSLRRPRLHCVRHRGGASLQGAPRAAQAEVCRLRLYPRVRRGAQQGLRHHRD